MKNIQNQPNSFIDQNSTDKAEDVANLGNITVAHWAIGP